MYLTKLYNTITTKMHNAYAHTRHMLAEGVITLAATLMGLVCVVAALLGAGLFAYYTSLSLIQNLFLIWATVAAVVYSMNKILPNFFQISIANITEKFTNFNLNVIKRTLVAIPSMIYNLASYAFSFGRNFGDASMRKAMNKPIMQNEIAVVIKPGKEPVALLEINEPQNLGSAITNFGKIIVNGEIEDLDRVGAQLTFAKNLVMQNTAGFFSRITDVLSDHQETTADISSDYEPELAVSEVSSVSTDDRTPTSSPEPQPSTLTNMLDLFNNSNIEDFESGELEAKIAQQLEDAKNKVYSTLNSFW